jgi:hypothetical protein
VLCFSLANVRLVKGRPKPGPKAAALPIPAEGSPPPKPVDD